MSTIRVMSAWLPLALGFSMGCSHATGSAPGSTSPATGAPTPGAYEASGGRQQREMDPANAVFRAAVDLQLSPEQTVKVRSLEEQLEANKKDTMAAFRTLHTDLAAQIRTGQIDKAKVEAKEAAAVSALQTRVAKESDALSDLHAILDSSQRRAVVASVRAKQSRQAAEHAEKGAGYGGGPRDFAKRRLDHLTRELGLDAMQQDQVTKWLSEPSATAHPRREEMRQRFDTLLNAFEGETFDAKAVAPPNIGAEIRERIDREVAFLSKVVSILRTDQREKLAASLERRVFADDHDEG